MNFFNIFFWNFLARFEYERNSGVKFCFHLFGLSHPVWAKNNVGKRFYNFWNFFTIFFRNFLSWVEYERNSGLKFFSLFRNISHPCLYKNCFGMLFFIFWNFLAFFFWNGSPAWVRTEFATKTFFSLSWPISSRFG